MKLLSGRERKKPRWSAYIIPNVVVSEALGKAKA